MDCVLGISSLRVFHVSIELEKNRQLFCQIRVSKCNSGFFLSFHSLSVCWLPAGYWRPARISRILAVFGFSSPILETHQLVYLVLWSHRYTDPNKCFQSDLKTRVQDRGRDTGWWWWWLLHSKGWWTLANVCIWLIKTYQAGAGSGEHSNNLL